MRAATEGNLPPVMPQGNPVEVLGREVRQESSGQLMLESSPSCQRRPPCKSNRETSDEAADAAAVTYLLTYLLADMKKREEEIVHARDAPGLQKSPPEQGGGYRRFTPPSTLLTAKGLRVLGVGWRGIFSLPEVGHVLYGVLMPFEPLSFGLYWSTFTTTRTSCCPR